MRNWLFCLFVTVRAIVLKSLGRFAMVFFPHPHLLRGIQRG